MWSGMNYIYVFQGAIPAYVNHSFVMTHTNLTEVWQNYYLPPWKWYLKANKLFKFLQLKKNPKNQSKSCVNRKVILLKNILVIKFPGPHLSLLPPELDFKRGWVLIDASLSSYLIYFCPGNSSSKKTFTCFSVITHLPKDKKSQISSLKPIYFYLIRLNISKRDRCQSDAH